MTASPLTRFAGGLSLGVLGVALAATALALAGGHLQGLASGGAAHEALGPLLAWAWRNLGLSLPVFALVLVLYATHLGRLRAALESGAPPETVAQADHLTDVWIGLFFGIGVVWTAIGMRGALVATLSGPGLPAGGPEVLRRMVDGGILLALSTTIFGGVGGYLMRVWKALSVGAALKRYYTREARRDLAALRASVSALERRLCGGEPGA